MTVENIAKLLSYNLNIPIEKIKNNNNFKKLENNKITPAKVEEICLEYLDLNIILDKLYIEQQNELERYTNPKFSSNS